MWASQPNEAVNNARYCSFGQGIAMVLAAVALNTDDKTLPGDLY